MPFFAPSVWDPEVTYLANGMKEVNARVQVWALPHVSAFALLCFSRHCQENFPRIAADPSNLSGEAFENCWNQVYEWLCPWIRSTRVFRKAKLLLNKISEQGLPNVFIRKRMPLGPGDLTVLTEVKMFSNKSPFQSLPSFRAWRDEREQKN